MTSSKIETFHFAESDSVPNHPRLPLVVMHDAFPTAAQAGAEALAAAIEAAYEENNWGGTWRWGVYPFTHYHSTAHEVLTCFAGHARLQLGGDGGIALDVRPGDVLVLPAGTGHRNLGSSDDFQVVGAYPVGQEADLVRVDETGPAETAAAKTRINNVPLPTADPVRGDTGPLLQHWRNPHDAG